MQIMQELPTNKPNFPFKHTEDFNQTRHVVPYIDLLSSLIISVFILIPFVLCKNLWKGSLVNGHVMVLPDVTLICSHEKRI